MMKILIIMAAVLTAASAHAEVGCNGLNMQTASSVNFNSSSAQQITVNVRRNNTNHGCDYFLTFSRGMSMNYNRQMFKGSDVAPYQLYRTFPYADVLKDLSDAVTNSDIIASAFPDNAGSVQNSESYRAVLGNVSSSPVGLYFDTVTVRLYEGTLSSYFLRDTSTVNLQYSSTRSIDLSLVPTGGAFSTSATSMSLDFGTMYTGESKAFDIVLVTNAGYSLSMSSQNAGQMKHASLTSSAVPYTLTVNSTPISLGGGSTVVARGSGASPSGGSRVPVVVTIGELANSVSGTYKDSVTVTVQTTE
ncbi:MAG: spore coat protein U domain-containing protein [Bdellovibrionia bacterium]